MALHNPLADGQSDPGARIFLLAVQAFEDEEDAFVILGVYAHAVVHDGDDAFISIFLARYMDARQHLAVKFDGVAD